MDFPLFSLMNWSYNGQHSNEKTYYVYVNAKCIYEGLVGSILSNTIELHSFVFHPSNDD